MGESETDDVFMCGVIKEKFVQWEPLLQSGPRAPERLFLSDQSTSSGWLSNILPGSLGLSEECVRDQSWPAPGNGTLSLGVIWKWLLDPGSPTHRGRSLWTPSTSLSFNFVRVTLRVERYIKCLAQSMGHLVGMQRQSSLLSTVSAGGAFELQNWRYKV